MKVKSPPGVDRLGGEGSGEVCEKKEENPWGQILGLQLMFGNTLDELTYGT